jgi:hypothetical protein
VLQNDFSPFLRVFEGELAEACAPSNYNIGLLSYGVLLGGTLSGKYLNGYEHSKGRHALFEGERPGFLGQGRGQCGAWVKLTRAVRWPVLRGAASGRDLMYAVYLCVAGRHSVWAITRTAMHSKGRHTLFGGKHVLYTGCAGIHVFL